MEHWQPEIRDPEYGFKLARLRERLAQAPDQPLVLILGSCRPMMGIRPDSLPTYRGAGGEVPLVFNFGLSGATLSHQLLYLNRLLRAGIHPRRVLIEACPVTLFVNDCTEIPYPPDRLGWGDLGVLRRFVAPAPLYAGWCYQRLLPWFSYRYGLLNQYAPSLLLGDYRQIFLWLNVDRSGYRPFPRPWITEAEYRHGLELAHAGYGPLLQRDHIASDPDQALRELLTTCRREGIAASLYIMPEGTDFQSWYTPAARAAAAAYLDRVSREYDVSVADGRDWLADSDFLDSIHPRASGAAHFTERFGREVLQPLLEGPSPTGQPLAAVR
jgi:hypothetical protein